MDSEPSAWWSLARTAAIVVPSGLALYLIMARLAGQPGVQYWGAILLAGPLSIFLGYYLLNALRGELIAVGRQAFERARQPVAYWASIAWFGIMTALLIALCLYAAVRLIAD